MCGLDVRHFRIVKCGNQSRANHDSTTLAIVKASIESADGGEIVARTPYCHTCFEGFDENAVPVSWSCPPR